MSSHKKLISLGAAAVLALGLAACGGGGGPSTTAPTPKTVDLTGLTSGWMLGATGKLEIKAGASMDSGDVKFTCDANGDDCVVTVSATGATATGGDVTASDSQAFTDRLASELAEAKLVIAAIELGSAKADLNTDTTDLERPFTIDGGVVRTTNPDTAGNTDDDLKKSDDKPAMITGWTGSIHTRNTAATTGNNPTPEKDDTVVSYTDLKDPGSEKYKTYYATAGSDSLTDNVADPTGTEAVTGGDTYVDWTGVTGAADVDHDSDPKTAARRVLTLSSSPIAKAAVDRLFSAADFGEGQEKLPGNGDDTTRTYDDTDGNSNNGNQVSIAAMFHGVAGTFECSTSDASDTCTVRNNGGALTFTAINGIWTFVPDDDSGDVAGVKRDVDYIDFGYWLETTTASDGTESHKVQAFGTGKRTRGEVSQVTGEASYAGKATGLYVKKQVFDSTSGKLLRAISGQFTADAALQAVFGGSSVAPDNRFFIDGSVTNFMDANGKAIDSDWTVTLMKTGIGSEDGASDGHTGDSGTVSGKTTGGGDWTGTFHGAGGSATPAGVSGTFDGHFSNGHVYGAYGVKLPKE